MKKLIAVLMLAAFAGTTFNGDPGDARQSGEQEDRQVRRQEEGQR